MIDAGFLRLMGKPARKALADGTHLRLLTAAEVLAARREGAALCSDAADEALCVNACLLARAWWRGRKPCAASGAAILARLSVSRIQSLAKAWADFDRAEDPGPDATEEEIEALKKAWSTRLHSAFTGVCSALQTHCRRRRGSRT